MYKFDTNVLSRSSSLNNLDVSNFEYRTRAIISRGLHFFYSFFTVAVAYTADNLCTKQGNVGLKSAVYKQELLQIKSGL